MITAFIKRDFLIEKSYRFNLLLRVLHVFFFSSVFFYISKLVGKNAAVFSAAGISDYFSFVIFGLAFSRYLGVAMSAFNSTIQNEQQIGTIGMLFMSPVSGAKLVVYSSVWQFIYATFEVAAYFFFASTIFGASFNYSAVPGAVVLIILTISALSGLGLLSASFILLFKKGDPINWVFVGISELLCGVYFPVELLPAQLRFLSSFFPLTYSLSGVRKIMLETAGWKEIRFDLLALLAFTAILLPAGIYFFNYAVKSAKKNGTLETY